MTTRAHAIPLEPVTSAPRPRALRRWGSIAAFLILALAIPSLASAVPTIVSIVPTPAVPVVYGTPITWTVTATGGTAPLQYQFLRYDAGVWNIVKAYSTGNTFSWTPAFVNIGQHDISVWVKSNGSVAVLDAAKDTGFFNITGLASVTALTANPALPRVFGTTITWTATATGAAPIQYKFWRFDKGVWAMVQNYSTTNTFAWTPGPTDVGQHDFVVWVKANGSPNSYDATREFGYFNITGTAAVSAITPSTPTPASAGTPILWTATATGTPGPLQYQFWRLDGTVWKMVQDYSASNTYNWITGVADVGNHYVSVWVRNLGSSAGLEASRTSTLYVIGAAKPLALTALQNAPDLPRPHGSTILFKTQSTGGLAPLSYRFYRYNYQSQVWTIVQDWSPNDTLTWTPAPSEDGDYAITVWVKNAGSIAAYDGLVGTPRFSITPPTTDIIRLLEQATWGPTTSEIERVRTMGYQNWIVDQLITPPTGYPAYAPVPDNPAANCTGNCQRDNYTMYPMQNQFFENALYGRDQLRQRVAWALHSLVVTSGLDLPMPSWSQPYHNAIYQNAFGNYRDLLEAVTINPGMGEYLNMNTSTKNNPNENYAREVMQLFSIGTDLLNIDGTPQKLADGTIIPAYDQFVVTEMARAFTGWHFAAQLGPGITNYKDPMVGSLANHDIGSKQLLNGFVTSPGVSPQQDLDAALDNIFNHPNMGPYLAKHLIMKLVTSNPTPGYVQRIASAFNDNGFGIRGNMQSVILALLLDPEARNPNPPDPNFGHLKDPVIYSIALLRAMNTTGANGQGQSDGVLQPTVFPMGEDPLRPATVFSYYPADYLLPGGTILAPEFGIFQSTTALKRANFVNQMVFSNVPTGANNPNGTAIDLSKLTILAANPNALVQELSHLLMHDSMSPATQTQVLNAVNAVAASNPMLRAQTALYLVASSSQYQVAR